MYLCPESLILWAFRAFSVFRGLGGIGRHQPASYRGDHIVPYGPMESTYKIMAHISYGVPIIQLFEDGRALGTRDYSSPKRAINAIREILRCAGYEL